MEFVEVGAPAQPSAATFERSAGEFGDSSDTERSAGPTDETGVDDEAAAEVARTAAVHALEHRLDHMLERYRTARDEHRHGSPSATAVVETPDLSAESELERELAEELQAAELGQADDVASWENKLRGQTASVEPSERGDASGTDPDLTGDVYYSEEYLDPVVADHEEPSGGATFEPFSSPAELMDELPPAMDPLLGCRAVPIDHCHEPPFPNETLAEEMGDEAFTRPASEESIDTPAVQEWSADSPLVAAMEDDETVDTEAEAGLVAGATADGEGEALEDAPAAEVADSSVDEAAASDRFELDLAGEALDLVYETRAKLSERSHQFPPQIPRQQAQDFQDFVPLAEVDSEDAEYLEHVRQEWDDETAAVGQEPASPDLSTDVERRTETTAGPAAAESKPPARENLLGQYRNLFSLLRRRERRG